MDTSCNEQTYPLCLLPRKTMSTNKQHLCLHHILASKSIETLQKYCQYTCQSNPNFPIITELLPNKYLITNINTELTLNCEQGNISRKILPITAGTKELSIPCNCNLYLEDMILITKLKPCDSEDLEEPQSINLLPATWSKIKTLKLFNLETKIRHQFDNLSEIIDANWTINNPTFTVSNIKKIEHIQLKNNEFDIFNDTKLILYILLGWTTFLTVIILILIYCLHIQHFQIKLMIPRRDYNDETQR